MENEDDEQGEILDKGNGTAELIMKSVSLICFLLYLNTMNE